MSDLDPYVSPPMDQNEQFGRACVYGCVCECLNVCVCVCRVCEGAQENHVSPIEFWLVNTIPESLAFLKILKIEKFPGEILSWKHFEATLKLENIV